MQVGKHDFHVAAELPQDLTARAAGRREVIGIGDNRYSGESARAFGDRFEDGDPFRTDGQTVSCVFDVTACVDTAGIVL